MILIMKRTVFLLLICSCFFTLKAQNASSSSVYVSGRGHNQETAVLDALMQAVSRKNKTYISSKETVHNDQYSGQQSALSFGRIAGFDIVQSSEQKGMVQILLSVSFKSGNTDPGNNHVATGELWNLAQQLKYFNIALGQIDKIFQDMPFQTILKNYSFKSISENNNQCLFEQNLAIHLDLNLYNAQMAQLSALLNIYSKNRRSYSYAYFSKNLQNIIGNNRDQKKIFITDGNLKRTEEYAVPNQFFDRLKHVLKDRDFYVLSKFLSLQNQQYDKNLRKTTSGNKLFSFYHRIEKDKLRYHIEQDDAIMLFPLLCPGNSISKNRSVSVVKKLKLRKHQIQKAGKCQIQHPILATYDDNLKENSGTSDVINDSSASTVLTVEASGIGETPDLAEKDAVKEALLSVCGSAVTSRTLIKNDEVESEKITRASAGVVQKYEVVKNEQKRGAYICTVKAEVNPGRLLVIERKKRSAIVDFSPAERMLNQNASFEENGRNLAREVYARTHSSLSARLIGKPEMGPDAQIRNNHVYNLPCKIRISAKLSSYRKMVNDLTPELQKNAITSYRVNLYGQLKNINAALKKYQTIPKTVKSNKNNHNRKQYQRSPNSSQVNWHFAVVHFTDKNHPESLVFYQMPEKFMKGYREFHQERKKRRANWRASKNYMTNSKLIYLFVDFFNKENKAVFQKMTTIGSELTEKEVSGKYIWSPLLYKEKSFTDITVKINFSLNELKGDDLDCVTEIVYLYDEPRFDEFTRYDLEAFEYNKTINRKSPFFGHDWYYHQEVMKKRGTLSQPVSEYAVYYSHVADNFPLDKSWNNGGLGFITTVKPIGGAFEVLTMSPYSTVLQGDKVYSFNDQTFTDVKDLFNWLKLHPEGTEITVKTNRGPRKIVLPPRNMAQDYWQKQLPANAPIVPPLPEKVYKGFIDHEARKLYDQKKYHEAWEATKHKNPCDLELLGNLARALYFAKNEPQKQETSNSRQMGSINDYMDSFSKAKPHEVAEFAKVRGSAVGAFFYALYWEQFKHWQGKHNLRMEMHAASNMGSADADNYLAYIYSNGIGCNRHGNLALTYLKKSATQYHAQSEFELGKFYLYGWGNFTSKINKFKARYWLQRSAFHGNKKAVELLKML